MNWNQAKMLMIIDAILFWMWCGSWATVVNDGFGYLIFFGPLLIMGVCIILYFLKMVYDEIGRE